MGKPLPNGVSKMILHKITTGLIGLITGVLVLFSPGNAQAPTPTPLKPLDWAVPSAFTPK